jgi:hypothetical protein
MSETDFRKLVVQLAVDHRLAEELVRDPAGVLDRYDLSEVERGLLRAAARAQSRKKVEEYR